MTINQFHIFEKENECQFNVKHLESDWETRPVVYDVNRTLVLPEQTKMDPLKQFHTQLFIISYIFPFVIQGTYVSTNIYSNQAVEKETFQELYEIDLKFSIYNAQIM